MHCCCAPLPWEHAGAPMWVKNERERKHSRLLVLSLACELSTAPLALGKLKHISSATKIYNEPLKLRTPSLILSPHFKSLSHTTLASLKGKKYTLTIKNYLLWLSEPPTPFFFFFCWELLQLTPQAFSKVCGRDQVSFALNYRGFLAHWFNLAIFFSQCHGPVERSRCTCWSGPLLLVVLANPVAISPQPVCVRPKCGGLEVWLTVSLIFLIILEGCQEERVLGW